jgi:hypothetical protein
MSKLVLTALCVLAGGSGAMAMDPFCPNCGGTYDQFAGPPVPGLRFSGANTTILNGSLADRAGPCGACANGGVCVDWKLVSWYASWDGHHPHYYRYYPGYGATNGGNGGANNGNGGPYNGNGAAYNGNGTGYNGNGTACGP